jgi:NhaP-type Na+/H+ and K+/H+ antiporter
LEIFFENLFQFIAEITIQIFGEVLFDSGFHSLAEAIQWKEKPSPLLAAIGYLIWGGIIGALTLLVFPSLIIKSQGLRIINLVLTPIIAGLIMTL